MEEGDVSEALVVAERLRARRRSTGKSKLSGSTRPLDRPPARQQPAETKSKTFGLFKEKWVSSAKDLSEEEQLVAVREAIRVFSLLPKESKYAQHRLKLLHKIEDILTQKRHGTKHGCSWGTGWAACLGLGHPASPARALGSPSRCPLAVRGLGCAVQSGWVSRACVLPRAISRGRRPCHVAGSGVPACGACILRREERGEQAEAELQSLLSQLKL